jgi:hypothetical protein
MEKSLSSAQITASLSLLREPGFLPAGLPDYADGISSAKRLGSRHGGLRLVALLAHVAFARARSGEG